jgi:hypothetical protein
MKKISAKSASFFTKGASLILFFAKISHRFHGKMGEIREK